MRLPLACAVVLLLLGCHGARQPEPVLPVPPPVLGLKPEPKPPEPPGPPAPPDHITYVPVERAKFQAMLESRGIDFTRHGRRLVFDASWIPGTATFYVALEMGPGPYEEIRCSNGVVFCHEEWSL